MARASRSSKKQPAFDPSELEDLIFSPAVGKGVGSHLIAVKDMTTVVMSPASSKPTIDIPDMATVAMSGSVYDHQITVDVATVVTPDVSSVATYKPQSKEDRELWITEHGDLVSASRVRRIRLAQDVINSAEECVYDTLWNAKLIQIDERESCRLVQAGYDYLVKRTRLARKTIQRIIAKLLEKDFIAIEVRADIYQRSSTVYRVFSYKAVLERNVRKGRLYVAKMGPGFSYAKLLEDPTQVNQATNKDSADMTTVDRYGLTTIVAPYMATMVPETTVTVVKIDPTTVVKMSPYLLDSSDLGSIKTTSAIREAFSAYGSVDDEGIARLVSACKARAPDCTEDEIAHFIREKGAMIQKSRSRVYNPTGFLITAVPKCFSEDSLRVFRERRGREQEVDTAHLSQEQAAMDRWRREQEASLADPNVSEQEKHLIRLCLGLNTS